MSKIQKGNDLMVFVDGLSVAFATNHQISLSLETETVQTKDSGYDGAELSKNITWEITSDNLYIEDEFSVLMDKFLGRQYVDVIWGHAKAGEKATGDTPEKGLTLADPETYDADKHWVADAALQYYSGKALITSMQASAGAGDNSTYSITLKGSGSITPVKPAALGSGSITPVTPEA